MSTQTTFVSNLRAGVTEEIAAASAAGQNWSDVSGPVLVVQRALQNVSNNSYGDFAGNLAGIIQQGANSTRQKFPDVQWAIRAAVADGNQVTFQYTAKGTDSTTGRVITWSGSAVALVEGGQISRLLAWNEDSTVSQIQLGQTLRVSTGALGGTWVGAAAGVGFVAQLSHDATSGEVWGTIKVANVGTFTATGTATGAQLNLSASGASGRTISFAGSLVASNITGLVAGHSETVTLYPAS